MDQKQLWALEEGQIKSLLSSLTIPIPAPFSKAKAVKLLMGECDECEKTPSKMVVIYKGGGNTASIVRSDTEPKPCLPCQQKSMKG